MSATLDRPRAKAVGADRLQRNYQIVDLVRAGWRKAAVAARFNLTRQQVGNIVRQYG